MNEHNRQTLRPTAFVVVECNIVEDNFHKEFLSTIKLIIYLVYSYIVVFVTSVLAFGVHVRSFYFGFENHLLPIKSELFDDIIYTFSKGTFY